MKGEEDVIRQALLIGRTGRLAFHALAALSARLERAERERDDAIANQVEAERLLHEMGGEQARPAQVDRASIVAAADALLVRYGGRGATCEGGRGTCDACVGSCGVEEWRDLEEAVASGSPAQVDQPATVTRDDERLLCVAIIEYVPLEKRGELFGAVARLRDGVGRSPVGPPAHASGSEPQDPVAVPAVTALQEAEGFAGWQANESEAVVAELREALEAAKARLAQQEDALRTLDGRYEASMLDARGQEQMAGRTREEAEFWRGRGGAFFDARAALAGVQSNEPTQPPPKPSDAARSVTPPCRL